MALKFRRSNRLKSFDNSGFGSQAGGRFLNKKTGLPNIKKTGVGILERYSWYHTMLELPMYKFMLLIFIEFITVNIFFALVYWLIGIQHLEGLHQNTLIQKYTELFFFSAQTFTTVGYGRISPVGFWASLTSTIEAFLGLLSFAIATGLFYGRFSRPRAYLKFSENILLAPYKEGKALMFRVAPYKNNALANATINLSVALEEDDNGHKFSKFYNLNTTLTSITTLVLNWTIVHEIDEDSPFYGYTEEDFRNSNFEIFAFVNAFDEVFCNTVMQRTSYISSELIYGAKFTPMYTDTDKTTIMDLKKLNGYTKVELEK